LLTFPMTMRLTTLSGVSLWWCVQELQQKRAQRAAEEELESLRPTGAVGRRKPPPTNNTSVGPMSPADGKAQNTGQYLHLQSCAIICSLKSVVLVELVVSRTWML